MTKDKDGDDPKDNVLTFPSKPEKDTHYEIVISDFSPEELHKRMIELDLSFDACFDFTKEIEYTMHNLHNSLSLERLKALEIKLEQVFLEFTPEKDEKG
jgi:hypothetical protein